MKKNISFVTLILLIASAAMQAQTFYGMTIVGGQYGKGTLFKCTNAGVLNTLVNFNSTNGQYPSGSLIQATNGNLYGMASYGGASNIGTMFEYDTTYGLTTLASFNGSNGNSPSGSLIQAFDGNFYGMTTYGGLWNSGVIFQYSLSGTLTSIVSLNTTTGTLPYNGSLIQGIDSNLYGMTYTGGAYNYGTLFKCTTTGQYTVLINFNDSNGSHPWGSLMQAKDSSFYGMTEQGGSSHDGTIFKYNITTGILTTLVSFNDTNGGNPFGSLIQALDNNLYGMTSSGGISDSGTIFKCTTTGTLSALANLNTLTGDSAQGSLIQTTDSNFYGMTYRGGSSGLGTILKCSASGVITTLVNFNGTNGSYPFGDLLEVSVVPTGINEIISSTYTKLYPNPSTGVFTFKMNNAQLAMDNKTTMCIYNISGQVVFNFPLSNVNSTFSIDLSNNPSGIYLYRVLTETGELVSSGKMVIQK